MTSHLQLGELEVDVVRKPIKNIHLSVHPPTGRVTISAPSHLKLDAIRAFAIDKLAWIRKQQSAFRQQAREAPREYLERESHYLWGKRYLLTIVESAEPSMVEVQHRRLILHTCPDASAERRREIMEKWYREQLRREAEALIAKWQKRLHVKINKLLIRRVKTKWGSCNPNSGNILLNTELVKKPTHCLEYLIVHELVHLLERTHNAHFHALMDRHLPNWRSRQAELNRLPIT